jgi:hypothetical protein
MPSKWYTSWPAIFFLARKRDFPESRKMKPTWKKDNARRKGQGRCIKLENESKS